LFGDIGYWKRLAVEKSKMERRGTWNLNCDHPAFENLDWNDRRPWILWWKLSASIWDKCPRWLLKITIIVTRLQKCSLPGRSNELAFRSWKKSVTFCST
jgi:hypothetical protein